MAGGQDRFAWALGLAAARWLYLCADWRFSGWKKAYALCLASVWHGDGGESVNFAPSLGLLEQNSGGTGEALPFPARRNQGGGKTGSANSMQASARPGWARSARLGAGRTMALTIISGSYASNP